MASLLSGGVCDSRILCNRQPRRHPHACRTSLCDRSIPHDFLPPSILLLLPPSVPLQLPPSLLFFLSSFPTWYAQLVLCLHLKVPDADTVQVCTLFHDGFDVSVLCTTWGVCRIITEIPHVSLEVEPSMRVACHCEGAGPVLYTSANDYVRQKRFRT